MNQFRLSSLKIKGFRGFPESSGQRAFKFDSPCTLLFGVQGGGKSSVLHAIEWALFGDRVGKAAETGIAERKSWLVRNNRSTEAAVELLLERGPDRVHIFRNDSRKRGLPRFFFQFNGGQRQESEEALCALLGAELRDYMSCVHLHQEVIGALLVEEPASRKSALDRLMGLADLRNLADGIRRAKVSHQLKQIDNCVAEIDQAATSGLSLRQADLARAVGEGTKAGVPYSEFCFVGVQAVCESVAADLQGLMREYGLPAANLPSPNTVEKVANFLNQAKAAVRNLRNEQPAMKRQTELLGRRSKLARLKADYESRLAQQSGLESELQQIEQRHGPPASIQLRLSDIRSHHLPAARERLNSIHLRAGVLRETLKFLQSAPHEQTRSCPACEHEPFDAKSFRARTEQWQAEMNLLLAPAQAEISRLETEETELDKTLKQSKSLQERLNGSRQALQSARDAITGIPGNAAPQTDAPLSSVAAELQQLETQLAAMASAVAEANRLLNAIDDKLEKAKQILGVLRLQRDLNELTHVKNSAEYKDVLAARNQFHSFAEMVSAIEQAIAETLVSSAEQKFKQAKERICSIYRGLAQRTDFPEIEIHPEKYEVIVTRGGQSEVALRLLNKGDMNCAALSIFLALAVSPELEHKLGFIILDDPSQCLDAPHKQRLAKILDVALGNKQLVIATSEDDFFNSLRDKLAKRKTIYRMTSWAEDTGPEISVL
jgi:DNA repair exonuclease SbcCD ATPase subunit